MVRWVQFSLNVTWGRYPPFLFKCQLLSLYLAVFLGQVVRQVRLGVESREVLWRKKRFMNTSSAG